jgi:hypothetical protein
VKVSTDHALGATEDGQAIDGVLSAVEARPSSLSANAVAAGGLVAAMSFLTVLGLYYGRGPHDAWRTLALAFVLLGLAGALVAAASAAVVARSTSAPAKELPRHLLKVWRDSANGWTMFLLGCVLMLPAFALYSPWLVGDSDSARLIASIRYVREEDLTYLAESQEVLLPHLLFGSAFAVGGLPAAQIANVLPLVFLGGVVGFLVWRITRSPLGVLAGVLALSSLPAILDRAYRLPMYSAMLAFGFLGVFLAHRAIAAETRAGRWQNAILSGLCLVLSFEAHQVGQLFLVLTALLVLTARPSAALSGLWRVGVVVAVLSIPRLTINLLEGGTTRLFSNRVDFWTLNDYIRPIQDEFFDLPTGDSLGEYLAQIPEGLFDVWGASGLLALVLGLVGIGFASPRVRRLALAFTVFMLAVAVYRRLPVYTRYYSLLLVGSALAAGVGLSGLLERRWRVRRVAVVLGLVGLLASAIFAYQTTIEKVQGLERAIAHGPYGRLGRMVPPEAGVIGTRSEYLNFVSTNARMFGGQFLTEQEYATFLAWPSDRAVIRLMRRHDIEWVFVPDNPWKWVRRYNDVWLVPNHGMRARYDLEVKKSASFCRAARIEGAALYRLDPRGSDQVADGPGPRRCEKPPRSASSTGR